MCVYQEHNDDEYYITVRYLGCMYVHIFIQLDDRTTHLYAYWENGQRNDVKSENISKSIKFAALQLEYPGAEGILIGEIDTHSLRSGGDNELAISVCSDREIQKMGRWRRGTLMKYIREELACFSQGMSKDIKQKFDFVKISGGANNELVDLTCTNIFSDYDSNISAE